MWPYPARVRSVRRAHAERVYPRDREGRAFSARRNRVRYVEKDERVQSGEQSSAGDQHLPPAAGGNADDVPVGDLGSGSTTPFSCSTWECPSTDVSSSGDYGVYHSVFDNFACSKKFGDPDFRYEQEMARIYGLEVLRMSSADVLPYDYENYGKEILVYLDAAKSKSKERFGDKTPDFSAALEGRATCRKWGAKCSKSSEKCLQRRTA